MPRAAMSVATRIFALPPLNSASARSRCGWLLLPWMALAGMPLAGEQLHDPVGAVLGAGEDQHPVHLAALGKAGAQHHRQQRLLLALLDEADILLDPLDRGRGGRDRDLGRIGQELVGQLLDRLRHGRREEQGLALGRQQPDDLLERVDEAQVEHLVGLVEDEDLDLAQGQIALLDQVDQAARRGDEHVDAARHVLPVLADRGAAEHGRHPSCEKRL